jgi:hypothetical protein
METARASQSVSSNCGPEGEKARGVTSPFGRRLSSPTDTSQLMSDRGAGTWGDHGKDEGETNAQPPRKRTDSRRRSSKRGSKRKSGRSGGGGGGGRASLKTTLRSRARAKAFKAKAEV